MTQKNRLLGSGMDISLREITADTVRQICKLSDTLSPGQRKMVADNAVSIAQAYFCDKAWFRAIYAAEEPIGFVMLHMGGDDIEEGYNGVFLWRYMISGPYQGKGYGKRVINGINKCPLTCASSGILQEADYYRECQITGSGP